MLSRYAERPASLDNITLAEFAAYYDTTKVNVPSRNKSLSQHTVDGLLPEHGNSENEDDSKEIEHFKTKGSKYKRRKVPRILRSVHFNPDTDPEKHYRELIMLYSPWRDENNVQGDCGSYQERYESLSSEIEAEKRIYEPYAESVNTAEATLAENPDLEEAWNVMAPVTQQQEAMDLENQPTPMPGSREEYDIGIDLGLVSSKEQELNTGYELPDREYRDHMRNLNEEQLRFVYNTMHEIKTNSSPIYRFLSGGAGVGKSFVTRALYQMAVKFFNKTAGEDYTSPKVFLVAPTGKAAYNIHGNTIHSAFKIPANQKSQHKPLQTSTLNTFRKDLGHIKLVIIDEISMVGFNLFNCIHQRLIELKQSKEDFGGISILAVGDLFQLKPVMDTYIFQSSSSSYMPLAVNLWKEHFVMTELKQIMRQQDNLPFAQLLNRLREGHQTDEDIRQLNKCKLSQEKDSPYPHDVPHLFTTNFKVDGHNSSVIQRSEHIVYTVKAKDRIVGSVPETVRHKILKSFENTQNTRQLPTSIELSQGIFYDVTVNVDTEDGIINGASCKLMSVELNTLDDNGVFRASGVVWVLFQDATTGQQCRQNNRHLYKHTHDKNWTPFLPVSRQFAAGYKGQAPVQRIQFPLRPAHAKTVHRAQGDTISEAVIDLGSSRRIDHIHYVALSRLQSLQGLHLLELQENKISVSHDVKQEMQRLRSQGEPEKQNHIHTLDSHFKICFLNSSSLNRHIVDVRSDFNIAKMDVTAFCETRLIPTDTHQESALNGFHQHRQDSQVSRQCNKRPPHGLAVYSKSAFLTGYPKDYRAGGIEICVFKVADFPSNITVVALYKPPKVPVRELLNALSTVIAAHLKDESVIVMGDFNVDVKDGQENALTRFMTDNVLQQLVKQSTSDYNTTIDLIFTNLKGTLSGVIEVYYSDHKIIWAAIPKNF